jgi:hypothetical protein
MKEGKSNRLVYYFLNTCDHCFNDIRIPLLGHFSEEEQMVQSVDGKGFFIIQLIGHPSADFVASRLAQRKLNSAQTHYQVLIALADGAERLSSVFPRCTQCNHSLRSFHDNERMEAASFDYITWNEFNRLTQVEKRRRLDGIILELGFV